MNTALFTIFALCLLAAASAQVTPRGFEGGFVLTNKATPGSVITGTIWYDADSQKMRLDYDGATKAAGKVSNVWHYSTNEFWKYCSKCEYNVEKTQQPRIFGESSDVRKASADIVVKGKTCLAYAKDTKTSGGVSTIWVTPHTICQVDFKDGRTFAFSSFKGGKPWNTKFAAPRSCPKKICNRPVDVALVMDETGSISASEWVQLKTFATGLVNELEIGAKAVNMGVAYFSGRSFLDGEDPQTCCGHADVAITMSASKSNILAAINGHKKKGGHTCIGCGIEKGSSLFPNKDRTEVAPRVMIVVTDGFNNRETNFFQEQINQAKARGITIYAVGVGTAFSPAQLRQIASDPKGVFQIGEYKDLAKFVGKITKEVCSDLPPFKECGTKCKGVCGCNGVCLCPTKCASVTCRTNVCTVGSWGSSCRVGLVNTCPTTVLPTTTKSAKTAATTTVQGETTTTGTKTTEAGERTTSGGEERTSTSERTSGGETTSNSERTSGGERTSTSERTSGGERTSTSERTSGGERTSVVILVERTSSNGGETTRTSNGERTSQTSAVTTGDRTTVPAGETTTTISGETTTDAPETTSTNEPTTTVIGETTTTNEPTTTVIGETTTTNEPTTTVIGETTTTNGITAQTAQTKSSRTTGAQTTPAATTETTVQSTAPVCTEAGCDDGNPCTVNSCFENKCIVAPVTCKTTSLCAVAVCNPTAAVPCQEVKKVCAAPADKCHTNTCDDKTGSCVALEIPGALGACKICGQDPLECARLVEEGSSGANTFIVAGAIIGGAALVAVGAVALGFFLSRRMLNAAAVVSDNPMGSAVTNPLFEQGSMEGTNPLFQGSSSIDLL